MPQLEVPSFLRHKPRTPFRKTPLDLRSSLGEYSTLSRQIAGSNPVGVAKARFHEQPGSCPSQPSAPGPSFSYITLGAILHEYVVRLHHLLVTLPSAAKRQPWYTDGAVILRAVEANMEYDRMKREAMLLSRLPIVAESILRSAVKLIPFVGSALDQAIFGTKDALADAELRKQVGEIHTILIAQLGNSGNQPPDTLKAEPTRSPLELRGPPVEGEDSTPHTITGKIVDGKPIIEGIVLLPGGRESMAVTFLIDTAAQVSCLTAADAFRAGVDPTALPDRVELRGIGGHARAGVDDALLVFVDEDTGRSYAFSVRLHFLIGDQAISDSLLGQDVLSGCRLVYEPDLGRCTITLLSPHYVIEDKQ